MDHQCQLDCPYLKVCSVTAVLFVVTGTQCMLKEEYIYIEREEFFILSSVLWNFL